MTDLKLEVGEGILLQTSDASRYDGKRELDIDELYLTNRNLICVYEKSNGFFSEPEMIVDRIPLSMIAIVNNVVQIELVDDDEYGKTLQIIYKNGKRELLELTVSPRKQYPVWKAAMTDAVLQTLNEDIALPPIIEETRQKQSALKGTNIEEKKFIFCSNCGEKLIVGSKFCNFCGTSIGNIVSKSAETTTIIPPIPSQEIKQEEVKREQTVESKRKTIFDGVIHKCPQCGEVINSFVSICPACGFELGGKTVSSSLQDFIDKINESEKIILNSPQGSKKGWASWSKPKRFWWVVLNIFFVCIPLVIYLVIPLVMIKATPKLSKEEQYKVSLIENFPFPNDRESILAALIFAKEKINFISKETINRKTSYWMRLWRSKAEQLKQKADMLFQNDSIVKQCYDEITVDEKRVNKIIKIKAIGGLIVLAVAIIFMIGRYGSNVVVTDNRDYNATFEWQTTGLFAEIPVPDTDNGKIVMETDEQINIELYNVTDEDFNVYVKKCRKAGYTSNATMTDSAFYATNLEGYDLNLFYDAKKEVLSIHITNNDLNGDSAGNNDDNASNKNETIDPLEENKLIMSDGTVTFSEDSIVKDLKVTKYHLDDDGFLYTILVIENPSNYNLSITANVKFYNKDGNLIGAEDGEADAVEKKTHTIMYFIPDEEYSYIECEFSVSKEDFYDCVVGSLSYESVSAQDKEIISVTNNGIIAGEFIEAYALFFKDGNIVGFDSTYITDKDDLIKPGKTITEELDCYVDYDAVKFYFTGHGER